MTLAVSWVTRLKTQILSSHSSFRWEAKQVTELASFISSTFPCASLKINRGMLLGVYYWKLPKSPPASLLQKGPRHCWNLKASFASPRLTSVVTLGWRLTRRGRQLHERSLSRFVCSLCSQTPSTFRFDKCNCSPFGHVPCYVMSPIKNYTQETGKRNHW